MNQQNKKLKIEKSTPNQYNSLSTNQNKRDIIKKKIMEKYSVSFEEAEKILFEIERREELKNHNTKNTRYTKNIPHKQILKKNEINNNIASNHIIKQKKVNRENNYNSNVKSNTPLEKNGKELPEKYNNIEKQQNTQSNNKNSKKSVDDLLEDIVPDYKKQISIKVDHVYLTFEVEQEKIDTIKEKFIRTLKRNKPEKMKIHALKDVSFQVYKGEKIGIIGFNGAGKSTLLNVITGIFPPDKGTVTTQGTISPLLSLGAGFDYNFSGRQNIMFNGAVLGYDREYLESKTEEIIEFSELGEFIDIPIKNYSSGMLAKLGFSIATSVNPDILIIDEILGVGDINFSKKSAEKMRSLIDEGTTLILVSHSIPQIRELCDKAIWIDKGSVRDIGEVNKVCDEYIKNAEKATNEQLANIKLVNQ